MNSQRLGIGFDLVEVDRVSRLMDRWGDRLLRRLLAPNERKYVASKHRPALHVAGMVAAKEACFKVLGLGPGQGVGWHDVVISHSPDGAPLIETVGDARRLLETRGAVAMAVSISHERSMAGAVAVLVMPEHVTLTQGTQQR